MSPRRLGLGSGLALWEGKGKKEEDDDDELGEEEEVCAGLSAAWLLLLLLPLVLVPVLVVKVVVKGKCALGLRGTAWQREGQAPPSGHIDSRKSRLH